MRPEVRLDSAVFQLTPTRTRCDLVVIANGKTEKVASGLLNPFLAHLKAAQDQIAKGGYSITLEPDAATDAFWFTKGTIERFVRFVSTPEILERVTAIESEIVQIDDAIAIQSNDKLGLKPVEDQQERTTGYVEGSKTNHDADSEKAIVLYSPGAQPNEPDSETAQGENSKAQLLRVLETRKTVLRKEQAMAFARAAAAAFEMENLGHLLIFAESFGASRLKKACSQFMELWKNKHESGQWIEVEAADAMSQRSEFPPFNANGIVYIGENIRQNAEALPDVKSENAGTTDQTTNPHPPGVPHEYYQGPYQQPLYPPWAMHPPPHYPVQAMGYYPNYPGAAPYYHPPYPPPEDPRFHNSRKKGSRRHSQDSRDFDDEALEDGSDQSMSETERDSSSHGHRSKKGGGHSGKKKSGVVIIKNLNYVASKKQSSSGSDLHSDSEGEPEDEGVESHRERKHKSSNSLKKREASDQYSREETIYGRDQEPEQGDWHAFQNFLLKAEEKVRSSDLDMFSSEKVTRPKMKEKKAEFDPLMSERFSDDAPERNTIVLESVNGGSRQRKIFSHDEMLMSTEGSGPVDTQLKGIEGGYGRYRTGTSDDFIVPGRENLSESRVSLDPVSGNEYAHNSYQDKSIQNLPDESFMIPLRSISPENHVDDSRTAIDIDIEFPPSSQKANDSAAGAGNHLSYEPDDLSMIPERGYDSISFGFDPAMEYDSEIPIQITSKEEALEVQDVPVEIDEQQKTDTQEKPKISQNGVDKRRKEALLRKPKPSRTTPLTEAQKRAESLRAYKADLMKVKREQEEEQIKRLERLKLERQKRIAARSTSLPGTSPAKPTLSKVSPGSHKSSKFSDVEAGSSQAKVPARTLSTGTSEQKTIKASQIRETVNRLSKSISSLPETSNEKQRAPEPSAESVRVRRLSEPKSNSTDRVVGAKSVNADQARRRGMPDETQTKKISAIKQLDQSKSATLPVLKVKSAKAPATLGALHAKESAHDRLTADASLTSDSRHSKRVSNMSNIDETVVIEKNVVMLENEVISSAPAIQAPGVDNVRLDPLGNDTRINSELGHEYVPAKVPLTSVVTSEVEDGTVGISDDQSYEVVIDYVRAEAAARLPSSEDVVPKVPIYQKEVAHDESMLVPESTDLNFIDNGHETSEKHRGKEPKGFRKLLKFGRKSHTPISGEGSMDSVDDPTLAVSSADAPLLKNLISQDELQAGGTPTKAPRAFSLLSPFRGKHSEKKSAAA